MRLNYDVGIKRLASSSTFQKAKGRLAAAPVSIDGSSRLTLGELLASARLVEAHLLALDFARVARHQARLGQCRLQLGIVVDQRARDAVTDGAGLPGFPPALNVDPD